MAAKRVEESKAAKKHARLERDLGEKYKKFKTAEQPRLTDAAPAAKPAAAKPAKKRDALMVD